MPIALDYPQPQYPYKTGYADVASVQQNVINWDPTKVNSLPTLSTVQDWLRKATAIIDSELAARGYSIPLQATSGFTVPVGFTAINGLDPRVYQHLEMIAAAYATSFVESSRHGSQGLEADTQGKFWMTMFDDFITRIATGADNFTAYGVEGPFPPEIDPAKGAQTGNIGAFVSTGLPTNDTEGPLFSRAGNLNW